MISKGTAKDPRQPGGGPQAPGAMGALLEDWITIWQSELAAMVLDRETQDTLLRLIDGWAAQTRGMLALMAQPCPTHTGCHDSSGPSRADAPSRPPAAAAAPDERDAIVHQLLARVAELERRLAGLPPVAAVPPDRGA